MKFIKKPIEVEAHNWNGSCRSKEQIELIFPELVTSSSRYNKEDDTVEYWIIKTLEGFMEVSPDDWNIKGIQGEFYPCKPDIFLKTYDKVSEL